MIQAPQTQYIPMMQPMQTGYIQNTALPVQYTQTQVPGVIYNYPSGSAYMPAQSYMAGKSQNNGVNIEIINPQGQGGIPQQYQVPAQFMPVQQPVIVPQWQTPYPSSQAIIQAPQYTEPMPSAVQVQPQASAPQQAPAPVQPQVAVVPQPTVVPAPQIQSQAPVVENPAPVEPSINIESFAGRLASDNLDEQKAAIENLAELVKNNNPAYNELLDTQIFDALTAVIDKNTSSLQGPTPEVIELRQKPVEQLSQADKEKAATPSELEKAELNKQYAIYTIAYMQERLYNEVIKKNGSPIELKDLPAIEKIVDTVKANPNPMLRCAGLSALSYIKKPEYNADLSTIFEIAKSDEDERVRETAVKVAEGLK